MIYKLDTDFTQIEQKEGLMQNLSHQAYIEVVSCEEDPRKDSGIILMPLEKLNFKAKKKESVFARSAHIGGTPANLSVVNFNVPVSGSGAGVGNLTYNHIVLDGYVKADGALLNRAEYSDLFEFANENALLLPEEDWANGMQGMYSVGDDSTTFRVPDLRGQFLRGLDDGRGLDTGRTLGSLQGDAIRNIIGQMESNVGRIKSMIGSGAIETEMTQRGLVQHGDTALSDYTFTFDASRVVPTAEENRPKNIALIAQIKY